MRVPCYTLHRYNRLHIHDPPLYIFLTDVQTIAYAKIYVLEEKMYYRAPGKAVCADVIPYYENGEFKLFYLRDYRDISVHGEGCPWCLVTTKDLVCYEDHGPVLLRGGEEEQDLYVFTGCCIKAGEEYVIFYTGHNPHLRAKGLPEQKILRAVSRDLLHWRKDENFVFAAPDWLEMHDFRDPFVFFDEERQEYCMLIAGRVKNGDPALSRGVTLLARSCDLTHWELDREPFYAPHAYFTHECPDLFRIGDWWYLVFSEFTDKIVTTYRMSRSPFGPWKAPKVNNFDGHAFYAAKSVSDGKRRILFGWNCIKQDERDDAPWQWGGTIIPHEIVQLPDGTLGVRCPSAIAAQYQKELPLSAGRMVGCVEAEKGGYRLGGDGKSLCMLGKIYSLQDGNYTTVEGTASDAGGVLRLDGRGRLGEFHRTYTPFRMDMRESGKSGIVMEQDGKRYEIVIEREGEKAYMKVLSPDDASHKVNSTICLPSDTGVFDVKIVCDGEFIEFFVNDTCALTAHTAMTGESHTLYLSSDGEAEFSCVNVSKLLPYGEID